MKVGAEWPLSEDRVVPLEWGFNDVFTNRRQDF